MPLSLLALAGLALPFLRGAVQVPRQQVARSPGGVVEPPPGVETLREEYFVIEALPPGEAGGSEDPGGPRTVVGLACCRRLTPGEGWQLEWDVRFPAEQTRVLHIERGTPQGSTLVWRELRPGSGRTLSAIWSGDGEALAIREWSGRHRLERDVAAPGGGILPLHLLELVRGGAVEQGTLQVFDPLSRSFEALRLQPISGAGGEGEGGGIELVRDDGARAAAWWLEGEDLLAFQWQAGHLRARRVTEAEYRERLQPAGDLATR